MREWMNNTFTLFPVSLHFDKSGEDEVNCSLIQISRKLFYKAVGLCVGECALPQPTAAQHFRLFDYLVAATK